MKTALITGASSGIGEAFARELATRQTNLILVARSQDKLTALAQELEQQHQIQTKVVIQDLAEANAGHKLFSQLSAPGQTVDLLINNAGVGDYGAFSDRSLSKNLAMVQLNIATLVELTGLFLPGMQQRQLGAIVNVSSIAAFQAIPFMAVYAATKAFVLNFSEALWAENRDLGVKILAVCPGPTESQFFRQANFPQSPEGFSSINMATPEKIVQETFQALDKNQSNVVAGGSTNHFIANLPRFLPRDWLVEQVGKQFENI